MNLYTFYTDSHSKLLNNYFLPSVPKEDDFNVIVEKFPQECLSGSFMESGWIDTMKKKVSYILRGIEETWGNIFIHSDCDVYFFKPFKDEILNKIQNYDLVGQHDGGGSICCGFFACKSNQHTKELFQNVLYDINSKNNDQHSFNKLKDKYIKSNILDDSFFSVNAVLGGKVWEPNIDLQINTNIKMLHANWTIGVENKCKLIELIRNKVS